MGIHVTARRLDSYTSSEGELGRFRPCTRAGAVERWHPCHREEAGQPHAFEAVERWHPSHREEAGQSYAFGGGAGAVSAVLQGRSRRALAPMSP